mmetsp:Transcript_19847/g.39718  ORF Transcript_19847/g.39718 Transcript_19847/m.39718 type:complete len:207 (+) Transcript_19847:2415-3035(+)
MRSSRCSSICFVRSRLRPSSFSVCCAPSSALSFPSSCSACALSSSRSLLRASLFSSVSLSWAASCSASITLYFSLCFCTCEASSCSCLRLIASTSSFATPLFISYLSFSSFALTSKASIASESLLLYAAASSRNTRTLDAYSSRASPLATLNSSSMVARVSCAFFFSSSCFFLSCWSCAAALTSPFFSSICSLKRFILADASLMMV